MVYYIYVVVFVMFLTSQLSGKSAPHPSGHRFYSGFMLFRKIYFFQHLRHLLGTFFFIQARQHCQIIQRFVRPHISVHGKILLCEIAKDRIVILSTHIVGDIEATCENIAVLNHGEILFRGTVSGLLEGGLIDYKNPGVMDDCLGNAKSAPHPSGHRFYSGFMLWKNNVDEGAYHFGEKERRNGQSVRDSGGAVSGGAQHDRLSSPGFFQ